MKVELVPIESVIPYARNPRKNEQAVAKVAASIKEFGWKQPIVVDKENVIIAGHTRLLAGQQLGSKSVPVYRAEDLTPTQVKAYRLADNRVAQEADWDKDLLSLEIADLQSLDFDMALTGFNPNELDQLIALSERKEGKTDPDDIPEDVESIAKPGDLWQLGKHRLYCGDCTQADSVGALLGDVKPHLMVTDPPYGVEYDPGWRTDAGINKNKKKMGKVGNDDRADWSEAWDLYPGDVAYVWSAPAALQIVSYEALKKSGFEVRQQIIWAKERMVLGRGNYHYQHEPCWYAVREKKTGHWAGDRSQTTLWKINARDDSGHGHSTQKPVECMLRPIENNSSPGQAVYDPFVGSGTTIIAAEQTARVCYAMEINPEYVDICIKRWEDFTGDKAVNAQNLQEVSSL